MTTIPQTQALSRLTTDIASVRDVLGGVGHDANPLLGMAASHVLMSGGKLVRPRLSLLAGYLISSHQEQDAPPSLAQFAAISELIHAASLVHDDTLDDSETRRGVPTVNARWGVHTAVLLGDYMLAQAAIWTARLGHLSLMDLLATTIQALVQGELAQMNSGRSLNEDDYYQRIAGKTGSLFVFCCQGAAILSGASAPYVAALRTYGEKLGLAFQVVDDVLDFTGSTAEMGKPVGGDLLSGIVTLPALYYINGLAPQSPERRSFEEEIEAEALVQAIAASPAIEAAHFQARRLVREAIKALTIFPPGPERAALEALAEEVVVRRS